MRRGRVFILLGLILLLATAALLLLARGSLFGGGAQPTPAGVTPTVEPDTSQIVIATQDLPRGAVIPPDAVALAPWPTRTLPLTAVFSVEDVVGRRARTDIPRGQPVLNTMVTDSLTNLAATGSDAALSIPMGQVAVSIPINRLSAVGYAIQDGDHVDVMISMLFVDLDQQFQSILPNFSSTAIEPFEGSPATAEQAAQPGTASAVAAPQPESPKPYLGFFDSNNGLALPFYAIPQEAQRPRLVTQRIIQDAMVLHVGTFSGADEEAPAVTPTPEPVGAPTPTPGAVATAEPLPDIVTLVVAPQDALVLNYAIRSGADLSLALRSAGDTSRADTESVTLQYMIERFNISVPARQAYGTTPRIDVIVPPCLDNDPPGRVCRQPDNTIITKQPPVTP